MKIQEMPNTSPCFKTPPESFLQKRHIHVYILSPKNPSPFPYRPDRRIRKKSGHSGGTVIELKKKERRFWMDRTKGLQGALDYLEEHMDGEINDEQAAACAQCGVYHFQKLFSMLTGMTLHEYIRMRRMTLAAAELQKGARVIDVANTATIHRTAFPGLSQNFTACRPGKRNNRSNGSIPVLHCILPHI